MVDISDAYHFISETFTKGSNKKMPTAFIAMDIFHVYRGS